MIESVTSVKAAGGDSAIAQRATAASAKADAALEASREAAVAPISPRLRPDFLSGAIVTEFVGNDGQVTLQTPTVAALAYLRAGLDANGQAKIDPNASQAPAPAPAELIA